MSLKEKAEMKSKLWKVWRNTTKRKRDDVENDDTIEDTEEKESDQDYRIKVQIKRQKLVGKTGWRVGL